METFLNMRVGQHFNRLGRQQIFHIGELGEIAVARRAGVALAKTLDFDEVRAGEVALVITEAATNIAKHAAQGEILLRSIECGDSAGVEIIAIDKGPGISNIHLLMQDGVSTAGTYGVGLGAIGRLTHEFDVYSHPDAGTILYMVVWAGEPPTEYLDWQIGAVCIPIAGEFMCGDDWSIDVEDDALVLLVADGLGHGPEAARASNAATAAMKGYVRETPTMLMQRAHTALRGTRGAAAAIAKIDVNKSQLDFAGVGNIAMSILYESSSQHLLSHNGIVGSNLRKVQEFSHPWREGATLMAHSDGIGTRWDLRSYPGLLHSHPGIIAAVLYRDFTRGRDDSTVVVLRNTAEQ